MKNEEVVLITGGTGFIGSYLAMHLLETTQEQIVLFDRDPDKRRLEGFNNPDPKAKDPNRWEKVKRKVTFEHGDICVRADVDGVFEQYSVKSVYHLGALLSAGAETNPTQGYLVVFEGTRNVLDAA
jgi:threonine 3-dehydrogenase